MRAREPGCWIVTCYRGPEATGRVATPVSDAVRAVVALTFAAPFEINAAATVVGADVTAS